MRSSDDPHITLAQADGLLRRILGNTDAAADKATDVTRLPRWRKAESLAKSFLGNTLHILGAAALVSCTYITAKSCCPDGLWTPLTLCTLLKWRVRISGGIPLPSRSLSACSAGNMTNASMQAFILRRLRASAAFLRPFEKLTRKLLKAALQLFGTAEDHAVRVQAILFIRQVAIVLPQPALDMCLKV